jgi:hypothetical protein
VSWEVTFGGRNLEGSQKKETLGRMKLHAHRNSTLGVKTKGYETSPGLGEGKGTKGMTMHKRLKCVVPERKPSERCDDEFSSEPD